MTPRSILGALMGLMSLAAADPAAADAGDGELIARQWCSACHATEATSGGTDTAPPWRSLAADPGLKERLRALLADPDGPMRHLSLTEAEIRDLLDYIRSLATP